MRGVCQPQGAPHLPLTGVRAEKVQADAPLLLNVCLFLEALYSPISPCGHSLLGIELCINLASSAVLSVMCMSAGYILSKFLVAQRRDFMLPVLPSPSVSLVAVEGPFGQWQLLSPMHLGWWPMF